MLTIVTPLAQGGDFSGTRFAELPFWVKVERLCEIASSSSSLVVSKLTNDFPSVIEISIPLIRDQLQEDLKIKFFYFTIFDHFRLITDR